MFRRRSELPRIAIAHQTIAMGDAIGNDITGSYGILEKLGFQVSMVCENVHPAIAHRFNVAQSPSVAEISKAFDVVLYHHSLEWPWGEECLGSFAGPIIAKYHNITPARFFEPYSNRYHAVCERGRAQTHRLIQRANIVHWQADSSFNADDLREMGLAASKLSVVPPFTRCDELLVTSHRGQYQVLDPLEILFVGRRAPNKGHRHLLQTMSSLRDLFPNQPVRLTIVGSFDEELATYYQELNLLEAQLGVKTNVRWLSHLSDAEALHIFTGSHIYLNLSEHEGFCVPVIEAQAIGLPVVSFDTTALRETVGSAQVLVPLAQSTVDYDQIAGIIVEVARDPVLREQVVTAGFQNVFGRFTSELLQNRFLDDVRPWLEPVRR